MFGGGKSFCSSCPVSDFTADLLLLLDAYWCLNFLAALVQAVYEIYLSTKSSLNWCNQKLCFLRTSQWIANDSRVLSRVIAFVVHGILHICDHQISKRLVRKMAWKPIETIFRKLVFSFWKEESMGYNVKNRKRKEISKKRHLNYQVDTQ